MATTKPMNFKKFINVNENLIYNCRITSIDEGKKVATAYTINKELKFIAKKLLYVVEVSKVLD